MLGDDDYADQLDDDLEYEPFEDVEWSDPDELDALDLDVLDDEISEEAEPTPPETPAPEPPALTPRALRSRRASPADAAPPTVELEPDTPPAADESAPEAPPPEPEPEPESEPKPADEPPPPPDVYCVLVALPPAIGASVLELRATAEIDTMPPPGVMLTPPFHTENLEAVSAALANWTRIHLPVQLEIREIRAEVIGAQQYVAAWTLDPQEEFQDAVQALQDTLADLIAPLPEALHPTGAQILIGDQVPAHRYPHVISHMQREFETRVWQSTDVQLVRRAAPASSDDDRPMTWELHQQFD